MDKLFCDLKTDEEKAAFFLSGRGYETGVISQAIQNDVAMAYHRCVEYKKELEALQSQPMDAEHWAELHRLRAKHRSSDREQKMWKAAAISERAMRVAAEKALQSQAQIPAPTNRDEYIALLDRVIDMGKQLNVVWEEAFAAVSAKHGLQSQDREDAERLDFLSRADIMGCSLVSDDDGRWAFSDCGVAPVPPEGGFTGDVSIVSWVEADMWKESPREAIDYAQRKIEGDGK